MFSEPVLLTKVEIRGQAEGRTLYRITDSAGGKYATQNAWLASLCQSAYEKQQRVVLSSFGGWYYRDLEHVEIVPVEAA